VLDISTFQHNGKGGSVGGEQLEEPQLRLGASVGCVDELLSQETKNPDPLAKEGESDVLRLKSDILIEGCGEGVGDGQLGALSALPQQWGSQV
jgi:hypothetical protein